MMQGPGWVNLDRLGLLGDVRFTPGSDRTADIPDRQLRAMNRSVTTYSITSLARAAAFRNLTPKIG